MKTLALRLYGVNDLRLEAFELPELQKDQILADITSNSICMSSHKAAEQGGRHKRVPDNVAENPIIIGHEIVGRVEKMGAAAQKRHGVKEGDRAVVEYAFGCGQCPPCLSGSYTLCRKSYTYGSMISCKKPPHLFGAYSDYLYIHPRANVHKVGNEISPELGVLICAVLGNAVRWLRHV